MNKSPIGRFGFRYPILVDERGIIYCGVGRWLAAQALGLAKIPVSILRELGDTEKRALALADNKIAANAGWDHNILAAELGELAVLLPEVDLSLDITGFEPAEVDRALGDLIDTEQEPAEDVIAAPVGRSISQLGDIWILGPHRLLCGDACDERNHRTLMGRDLAAMVFSDPPFNVRISSVVGRGAIRHREFSQASGEMSPSQFTAFLVRAFSPAAKCSRDGSLHLICMDWRHLGEIHAAGEQVYSELKNLVVWSKTNAGQGSLYRSQHELIFVFKNGEAKHLNNIELGRHGRNRSNVWVYPGVNTFRKDRLADLTVHPTVKPVALVADAMRDCSRRGDIVFDPLLGSGTTILAAEKAGRRGYGIEIDPLYVDVAIRRWHEFTKRDAILEATGQTFDEVAAERSTSSIRKRVRV